jgi:drug/metabolite transporter (DMT)-like permease
VLLLSSLSAAGGQLLIKSGSSGRASVLSFANPAVGGGLALYGLGAALWIAALSRAPLTQAYPYTALTFVLVFIGGAALFGETVPLAALAGVAFVLIGLLLLVVR